MGLSTQSRRDPLLSINIQELDGAWRYQWGYNGTPFLEFYAEDMVVLTDCLKFANAVNNGFKSSRIKDHPKGSYNPSRPTADKLKDYAAFIQLATRLGVSVKVNRFYCYHQSGGKGIRTALVPSTINSEGKTVANLQAAVITDHEKMVEYIWVQQAQEMFNLTESDTDLAAIELDVNKSIVTCFMGLRYVAAQTPSFIEDTKNLTPEMIMYPDAPTFSPKELMLALEEVYSVGGTFPYLLLESVGRNGYPGHLPDLIHALSAKIPGGVVSQMFLTQMSIKMMPTPRERETVKLLREFCQLQKLIKAC